jgi:hypothetical protein
VFIALSFVERVVECVNAILVLLFLELIGEFELAHVLLHVGDGCAELLEYVLDFWLCAAHVVCDFGELLLCE